MGYYLSYYVSPLRIQEVLEFVYDNLGLPGDETDWMYRPTAGMHIIEIRKTHEFAVLFAMKYDKEIK